MSDATLDYLRTINQPQSWATVQQALAPKPIGEITGEPLYEFFDTLSDDLTINPHSLSISVQPVASFIPWHRHDFAEIMVPLAGTFTIHLPDQTFTVNTDDLLLIGRQTPHHVEPIEKDAVTVNLALKDNAFSLNDLNFMRQSGEAASAVSNMLFTLLADSQYSNGRYTLFATQHEPKIRATIEDVITEYYQSDIQSEQIIRSDILALFSRLIRQTYHSNAHIGGSDVNQHDLLNLLLYIEINYREITLEAMAHHFGFHPNYLSAYLKKHTGYTFIKLVHLQRINTAASMLRYTNASVEQISARIGYENPSYFYKIFRQLMGLSPTGYRQKYEQK